jgi:hypothetical protein
MELTFPYISQFLMQFINYKKTRKEGKLQVTMRNGELGNEPGREFEIFPRDKSCQVILAEIESTGVKEERRCTWPNVRV